jgi:hypothetical protein
MHLQRQQFYLLMFDSQRVIRDRKQRSDPSHTFCPQLTRHPSPSKPKSLQTAT